MLPGLLIGHRPEDISPRLDFYKDPDSPGVLIGYQDAGSRRRKNRIPTDSFQLGIHGASLPFCKTGRLDETCPQRQNLRNVREERSRAFCMGKRWGLRS